MIVERTNQFIKTFSKIIANSPLGTVENHFDFWIGDSQHAQKLAQDYVDYASS